MAYPSDLSEEQWQLIKGHFEYGNYGKSRKHRIKALINAVFYYRAKKKGIWDGMMKSLVRKSREKMGKPADPSYSIIDSQSVKTTAAAEKRGIDGGKKSQRPSASY